MILRLVFLALVTWLALASLVAVRADTPQPARTTFTLHLKRGDFLIYRFVPGDPAFAKRPKALVIFGSGDGGFDGSEDHVGHALQTAGYEMLGMDCSAYADSDYDLATLQADTNTVAQSSLSKYGPNPPPVILGGWSMGAEQAVAAAGGPNPPPGLVGLLLLSPESRGRYGVRTLDRLDITPTGPGTFGLADFAPALSKLRVVQWDGQLDPISSTKWQSSLTGPHKEYLFPFAVHDFRQFNDDFLKALLDSVTWIMTPEPQKAPGSAID